MKKKVLIIGIDGATWKILNRAFERKHMPFLSSFRKKECFGSLESTVPAITPAAWGSFQTGMNPGKTGVFGFSYWDRKKKKNKLVNSTHLPRTLWERLSDAGYTVGTIKVPLTFPPQKINGFMVSGIMTPSMDSSFTYPPSLRTELLKVFPDYHIFNLSTVKRGNPHEDFSSYVKKMAKIIEIRKEVSLFLIDKYSPDVFMPMFGANDVLQHVFWCYLDKNHPLHGEDKEKKIMETFHETLDRSIKAFGKDTGKRIKSNDFIILAE